MSDATDRTAALALLTEWLQPAVAPTLTTTATTGEVDVILDRNKRASTWIASTAYVVNQIMMPIVRNGHRYRCVAPGTTSATDPYASYLWPTTQGIRITEGSASPALRWMEDGPEYPNIYDVRQAAYEGWMLRANKAAQFVHAGDLNMQEMYDHSITQAKYYGSISIG